MDLIFRQRFLLYFWHIINTIIAGTVDADVLLSAVNRDICGSWTNICTVSPSIRVESVLKSSCGCRRGATTTRRSSVCYNSSRQELFLISVAILKRSRHHLCRRLRRRF